MKLILETPMEERLIRQPIITIEELKSIIDSSSIDNNIEIMVNVKLVNPNDIIKDKYTCKYMFIKNNVMKCSKGKFTGNKCRNKHDSFHCIDTIPLDKL